MDFKLCAESGCSAKSGKRNAAPLLRSVLCAKPHLRRCLRRRRHCRIFFLADPRNAGRRDLGCPFGCKEAHRKQRSTQRSVEYYQDKEGKGKKRDQNAKRRAPNPPAQQVIAPTVLRPPQQAPCAPAPEASPEGWNPGMVEHVRMVSSLIEGRRVSREEVLEMLERVLRQHSICRRTKIDQTVAWLNEHPP